MFQAQSAVDQAQSTTEHHYVEVLDQLALEASRAGMDKVPATQSFRDALADLKPRAVADGAPVSGVLTVDGAPDPDLNTDLVALAQTGAGATASADVWVDGRYNVWDLADSTPYELLAHGFLPDPAATVQLDPGTHQAIDIDLTAGASVAGTVTDDFGPLADQTVTVTVGDRVETTVTDDDGTYQLSGIAPGTHEVAVDVAGLLPFRTDIMATDTPIALDIHVQPGASVTGSVDDGTDPVAGAEVTLRSSDPDNDGADRAVTTGPDGSFSVTGLEAGDWNIVTQHDGFAPSVLPVALAANTPFDSGPITLEPGAVIDGRVVNRATGAPVPNPQLVYVAVEGALGDQVTGDADGTFHLVDLPAGTLPLSISGGDLPQDLFEVDLAAGETVTRDFELSPVSDLTGRLVDEEGAPVEASIEVVPADGSAAIDGVSSGPDGQFTLSSIPAGDYVLVVGSGISVPISQGESTDLGDVTLDVSRLTGVVTDGVDPLAGQLVALVSDGEVIDRTVTSDDGTYEFLVTTDGDYTVVWSSEANGFGQTDVTVTAPDDQALVPFAPGTGGLSIDLAESSDTDQAAIRVSGSATNELEASLSDGISGDGPVVFEGLAPGTYIVEVSGADHAPVTQTVEVIAGSTATVDATLTTGALVQGDATDAEGVVALADVVGVETTSGQIVRSVTSSVGNIELVVPPGTYDFVVRKSGTGVAVLTDQVVGSGGATLHFDLVPGATLSGAVTDITGSLLDRSAVTVSFGVAGAVLDAADPDDGGYEISDLPDGALIVQVVAEGRATTSADQTIADGASEILDVEAAPVLALGRFVEAVSTSSESSPSPARIATLSEASRLGSADLRASGPELQSALEPAGLPLPISLFRAAMDQVINQLVLGIPEPERDEAREQQAEMRRQELEDELSKTTTQRLGKCRSVQLEVKATATLGQRRDILFQKWEQAYYGVTDYIAVPLLEAVKIVGTVAAIIVGSIELAAALGSASAIAYTTANAAAFAELGALGTIGAIAETLSVFINNVIAAFENGAAQEKIKSVSSTFYAVVDGFLSELQVLKGEDGTFLTRDNIVAFMSAKKAVLEEALDEIFDAKKVAEQTGKAIPEVRAEQSTIRQEIASLRAARDRAADKFRFAINSGGEGQYVANQISEYEVEISKLNKRLGKVEHTLEDLNVKNIKAVKTLQSIPGYSSVGKALAGLGQAIGVISDTVKLGQSLISAQGQFEAAADKLRNQAVDNEKAEAAYRAAIDDYRVKLRTTRHTLRTKPGCNDPDDEVDYRDLEGNFFVSHDPNEITGPSGTGDQNALTGIPSDLGYAIDFENLGPGSAVIPEGQEVATAAAARVVITTTLDDDVDPTTLRLGDVGIGPRVIDVPDGLSSYQTRVGPFDDPGGMDGQIYIDVNGSISGRTITWVIDAIDPDTGFVVGDLRGLLPPEDGTGIGKGYVEYTVGPSSTATSGTVVDAQATIVFDANEPISTNTWTNLLDDDRPTSTITSPLSGQVSVPFDLTWVASDPTTEVDGVDLLVRPAGSEAPFVVMKHGLTGGTTTITEDDLLLGGPDLAAHGIDPDEVPTVVVDERELPGLEFATVATDTVGNEELPPLGSEASVTVVPTEGGESVPPGTPPGAPGPNPPGTPPDGTGPVDPADCDPPPPVTFPDVSGSGHDEAISCLSALGVVRGFVDGSFHPERPMTRAQFATTLVRILENRGILPDSAPDAFSDDDGSVHEQNINRLAAIGIITGYGDGRLGPSDPVSRSQAVSLLVRALDSAGVTIPSSPPDAFSDDDGSVHEGALDAAAALGLVLGFGNRVVRPAASMTRGQLASLLYRSLPLIPL